MASIAHLQRVFHRLQTWRCSPLRIRRRHGPDGFTLIEMLIVTIMIGTLSMMAAPKVQAARRLAENARAIGDIKALEIDLYQYEASNGVFPLSLEDIGREKLLDPWGRPYEYLRIKDYTGKGKRPKGARKDRFLVPINSDFDLYSIGPDGASTAPLTAAASADDIVRANNGGFVGPATEF